MTSAGDGAAGGPSPAGEVRVRTSRPYARRVRVAATAVALGVLAAVAVVVIGSGDEPPVAAPVASPRISPAPPVQAASPTPSLAPVGPSTSLGVPVEVRLDAVGLDADVLPTASVAGAFDPPTFGEAYWIEAFGAPGTASDNTVYVLGHSWDEGDAVFNPLFDRTSQTSQVAAGDEVVVTTDTGDVRYEVERTERIPKTEIAKSSNEIWTRVPGRLLLITCFQNSDGGTTADNFVVFATVRS